MTDGESGMTEGHKPVGRPRLPTEYPSNKKYDQAFFLALAAKGKDAWNAWRRDPANKDVRVTFAGIDFSEAPRDGIDFSRYQFGDNADFSGCKWRGGVDPKYVKVFQPGQACFTYAAFGHEARFDGAAFGDGAFFYGVAFDSRAGFTRTAFGDGAVFNIAAFGYEASFDGAAFGAQATFYCARFGYRASFAGAAFGDRANFDGAAFGDRANFDGTRFMGNAGFAGKSTEQLSWALETPGDEESKEATNAHKQRHMDSWTHNGSGPDCFLAISFANAVFDGEANFSSRTFERAADFSYARFYRPPNFDAAINVARINFTGAYVGFGRPGSFRLTSDTTVVLRLRALRKDAEEKRDHDRERDLYIEERKTELGIHLAQRFEDLKKARTRGWPLNVVRFLCHLLERNWLLDARALISYFLKRDWILDSWALIFYVLRREWLPEAARLIVHLVWIAVIGVYWALADYGRSFIRPAAWLALTVWLFHFGYAWILSPLMPQADTLNAAEYARAEWMVALGNAVPFVGPLTIDAEIKKFLFCPGFGPCLPIPPEGFQALVIAQNVLSIILVFFIGLALRNYFRIK
jgi:hypothetical protein